VAAAPGGAAKKGRKKPPASHEGALVFSGGSEKWLSGSEIAEVEEAVAGIFSVTNTAGDMEPTGSHTMTYTQGSHGGETKTYALNEFLK
jgi:hypothetical protein